MLNIIIDNKADEPVYMQLKRQITANIDSGRLKTGMRVPSVRAISQMTGISSGTVAKAVAELKKESYLQGRGRGGLVVSEPGNISIGITGFFREQTFFTDRYYQSILAGVESVLKLCHYSLTFRTASDNLDKTFAGFRLHGVLTFGGGIMESRRDALEKWSHSMPLISIGGRSAPAGELSYVVSDNQADSRRAVECLLRAGHRQIAAIVSDMASPRLQGYRQALAMAGIGFDERLVVEGKNPDVLERGFPRIIKQKPTAVFDSFGSVWRNLIAKWPGAKDLPAVATYRDDPREWESLPVPHAIVRQPLKEMGAVAAERLLSMIKKRNRRVVQVVLPSEIIDCLGCQSVEKSK